MLCDVVNTEGKQKCTEYREMATFIQETWLKNLLKAEYLKKKKEKFLLLASHINNDFVTLGLSQ